MLELYGIRDTAASVVARLSPVLGMAFDGNEHASVGADSHYYDESEHFGTILVFDNVAGPFDNLPFPKFAAFPAVLLAVNPPRTGELRRLLLQHGFAALNKAEPEIQP
jgi:hypothetical protein